MIFNIIKIDTPKNIAILKTVSEPVSEFTKEIADFCNNMVETMFAANGVGLAAPQVGINKNIFVMRTQKGLDSNSRDHIIIINPQIIELSKSTYIDEEGCLSIPGILGDVKRSKELTCNTFTTEGACVPRAFSGLESRIFQHEIDHVAGILFLERSQRLYRNRSK